MRQNRWWDFTLAQCGDGTMYHGNRDNAGYGSDARLKAKGAVTAFLLSIGKETCRSPPTADSVR
ncbi:MAG: hypothetical protein R3F17_09565 [Planctomycetota bacterium]